MKSFLCFGLLMIVASPGSAWAADGPPGMEDATARQRAAVATMEKALSVQRKAISSQGHDVSTESFFLLAPPGAAAAPLKTFPKENCEPAPPAEIDAIIKSAAERHNLHPELLRGIIKQESAFLPCAVSPKGAMGLMQLMPATAAQFGVKDPFSPKENVDAGARFLKTLLDLYGDLPKALGAYNAGPANVNQAGGVPDFAETKSYVQSILSGLPADARVPKR